MTTTAIPGRSKDFRPDIQGLRAVAALLVATYHIWFERVSGGVDVFFAVSGFLITLSLLRQVESKGQIDFVAFWGRLARRLLPAAMLVLLVVSIASIVWLPRPLWQSTIQQILASALYLENWQLALNAVDYLAQGQSASPVQHYWALSVQVQCYLVWPCLFAVALLSAKRTGASPRSTLIGLVAAVFALSFTYSVFATSRDQAFTYFNTAARLWEFSLGALVVLLPELTLPKWAKLAAGWLGLTGIIACGFVLHVSQVFPGYAALWPTLCAVLVLLANKSGSRFGADRLLSSPPLATLGSASYGLYLWHWPLLIFYRWFTDHAQVGLAGGVAIIFASIGLSLLTSRWVEAPMLGWHRGAEEPRKLGAFLATVSVPVLLLVIAWSIYVGEQKQFDARPLLADHPDYPGARAWHPLSPAPVTNGVPVYPGLLAVEDDMPAIYTDGCYHPDPDPAWQSKHCVYGNRTSPHTIALTGGSHSAHWLPALDLIAKEQGWRVTVYSRSNCLFSVEIDAIQQNRWCREWNERTLRILQEDPPDIVITTATRGSGDSETVPRGFLLRWRQLQSAGIKVVAIRDTPWMKFRVPECLDVKAAHSAACSQPTARMLKSESPTELILRDEQHVHFIDFSEYFCDRDLCPPVIGNIIVYRDDSHITAAYARSLAPMLLEKLSAGLPPEWTKGSALSTKQVAR